MAYQNMTERLKQNIQKEAAFFSKEIYDRKREYAYGKTEEGLDLIAKAILERDNKEYTEEDIEELVEELEPIQQLSHARHEMHSSADNTDVTYMDTIGNQYTSTVTLLQKVNDLNKKYNIVEEILPDYFNIPEVDADIDSWEEICEYYGIKYNEDDYSDMVDKAVAALTEENRKTKDKASETIRSWFAKINDKYGTNFPS